MTKQLSNQEIIEANRDQLLAWAQEGKSYYWMAREIGLGERSSGAVSKWFRWQGIYRKPATNQLTIKGAMK